MPVDVTTAITIARPLSQVAAFAADPSNVPAWYENIKHVEWKSEPKVVPGARIAFVAHFLGKRIAYTYEIVEFVENTRLVMRTSEGPFPMETVYSWQSVPGGTRMTLRNHGEPAGFSALVAPFLSIAMRRANRKDLAALKRHLESTPGS